MSGRTLTNLGNERGDRVKHFVNVIKVMLASHSQTGASHISLAGLLLVNIHRRGDV